MSFGGTLLAFAGTALFGAGYAIRDPEPTGAILFGAIAGGLGTWGYLETAYQARHRALRAARRESEERERELAAQPRELGGRQH